MVFYIKVLWELKILFQIHLIVFEKIYGNSFCHVNHPCCLCPGWRLAQLPVGCGPTRNLFSYYHHHLNHWLKLSQIKPDWHTSGRPVSLRLCSVTSLEMILWQPFPLNQCWIDWRSLQEPGLLFLLLPHLLSHLSDHCIAPCAMTSSAIDELENEGRSHSF